MRFHSILTKSYDIEFDSETSSISIKTKGAFSGDIFIYIDEATTLHAHLGELIELAKKETSHDPA